jgi:hypothetical protein
LGLRGSFLEEKISIGKALPLVEGRLLWRSLASLREYGHSGASITAGHFLLAWISMVLAWFLSSLILLSAIPFCQ